MSNFGNVQLDQIITDEDYKSLGSISRENFLVVMNRIQKELESPLRLHASFPAADSKLNLAIAPITLADGAKRALPPVKSQVYSLPASTIDFQAQTTTGAPFVIVWPASTFGQFRRAGLSLLGNGSIQVLFSPEALTVGALANPGTVFVKSGVALGYIDLECTNVLGYFKTAGSTLNLIENTAIFRFSAGSGGGGGSGDANSFTENLKHRLSSSYYNYVTPVVFEQTEATLTDSATAIFSIVDGTYDFANAAENVISKQLFDEEFLLNGDDSRQIELHVEWFDQASTDMTAIYEVSLDAITYETLAMTRQGLSSKFTGSKLLAIPANQIISSQVLGATNTELNSTSQLNISAPFTTVSKHAAREITLEIDKLGAPAGSYIVSLLNDSGDVVYSKIALASTLASGLNALTLNGFRNVLPVGNYSIKIETDATYKTGFSAGVNSIRVRTNVLDVKYSISGHVYDLRVRISSSAAGKKLKAFGIFYDESVGAITEGTLAQQRFLFSGDLDTTSFALTRFLPDPDHMKVYDVTSGQVYMYPAFTIDGHNVVFPAGTFLVPGSTINLLFDQSEGVGYDYSAENANLLAANKLGSSDNTLDKSVSGRGILIRNEAGQLRELWLDANDNLNITAFKG